MKGNNYLILVDGAGESETPALSSKLETVPT